MSGIGGRGVRGRSFREIDSETGRKRESRDPSESRAGPQGRSRGGFSTQKRKEGRGAGSR